MSSATKYVLYLVSLHLLLGVMAYYLLEEQKPLLLAVEAGILFSAWVAYRIFRSIISPLQLLGRGAAALADQDFSVKLMPTGSSEMDRIVKVYNNMIDQLREERVSGRQQEAFLERLLAAAELGVVVLDYDGQVETMNPWMEVKCREETFRQLVLQPSLHPRAAAQNTFETAEKSDRPNGTQVLTGPGNRRYLVERATFIDRGFERGFLVVQDVTTDLLAAEKEAYGKVIRMMAHEVNNSNAAIISVLRTLLEAASEEDAELSALNKTYLPVVVSRAENMTVFMRNFARVVRLPPPNRQRLDLNELLLRTGAVMAPVLAEAKISLEYELDPNTVMIDADAAQLEQVVINALTNARESIGRLGGIHISSKAYPPGFVIADNGPGIPEPVAAQVFTPFFSTKAAGQGVGLTLTRDILEAHGAAYGLATEADEWTRMRVVFG